MAYTTSPFADDFEYIGVPRQTDFSGDHSINHALISVAKEAAEILQQGYRMQANGSNYTEAAHTERIAIRAIKNEYRKNLIAKSLTERELEVLQLVVDGCSNGDIAQKLYICIGTVKSHVRSILKKLYVRDRTQAAILALRSGLAF